MKNLLRTSRALVSVCLLCCLGSACGGDDEDAKATVSLLNDFNNPNFTRQPPWVICQAYYGGVIFDEVLEHGETSTPLQVEAGQDYVLMILSWADATCAAENCLPVASKNEEETVDGQTRTIALNVPNHQGPCPPEEGITPIPEDLYNRILALWPEYGFKPYAERKQNPQCLD